MNRVILYHATLPDGLGAGDFAALVERLPYAKRVGLAPSARERMLSLAGIVLALAASSAVAGRPMTPESLRFPAGMAPHFAEEGAPLFSISHSGRTVVAAARAEGTLGIDIEDAAATTLPEELRREWSAREAAAKAFGVGLRAAAGIRIERSRALLEARAVQLQPVRIGSMEGWLATDSSGCAVQSFHADPLLEIRRLAA